LRELLSADQGRSRTYEDLKSKGALSTCRGEVDPPGRGKKEGRGQREYRATTWRKGKRPEHFAAEGAPESSLTSRGLEISLDVKGRGESLKEPQTGW